MKAEWYPYFFGVAGEPSIRLSGEIEPQVSS